MFSYCRCCTILSSNQTKVKSGRIAEETKYTIQLIEEFNFVYLSLLRTGESLGPPSRSHYVSFLFI